MRVMLTITALVEIGASATAAINHSYVKAGLWLLCAATAVGWALAETSAQAWKRKAGEDL